MPVRLLSSDNGTVEIVITVKSGRSMLEFEEQVQQSLNEAGQLACREQLLYMDTDGSPIKTGAIHMSCKQKKEMKVYETAWGPVRLERNVYQGSRGGSTFCPLDQNARIVVNSTPYFARMASWKYAHMAAPQIEEDLRQNHGRRCSGTLLRDLANVVGSIAQAKEETWSYAIPVLPRRVATIALGLDGTTVLYHEGFREAMCGTITLYDEDGERLHTTYCAAAPEYGKETFLNRFGNEIKKIRQRFPDVVLVGIADGAADNWRFLNPLTSVQILDFYHASEYVAKAAQAVFPDENQQPERHAWLRQRLHELKHRKNGANHLMKLLENAKPGNRQKRTTEQLVKARKYFRNHWQQMDYTKAKSCNFPIGSGVTEAACKTLVKQRLCRSGMRWKPQGASMLLTLRTLVCSSGHWDSFWEKLDRYGFPVAHNLAA